MMDDSFIQFKGVTKIFGKNKVLDAIDLSIPEGKITGIIGASGEGKSTILKLIASFYKPTEGEITYYKRNLFEDIPHIKRCFGLAIEEGSFYEGLTVRENLYHFGRLYGVKKNILKRRIFGIAKFVGLDDANDVLAKNLSLGMKKRLDLACSLVHKPSVLILDEPTADLDPVLRNQMLRLIKKINHHGTTVIFTTQLLEEIDIISDNIAILYNEKIIEEGSLKDVKKKYGCQEMNTLFNKVFSKKGRKTYQESKEKKSKFDLKKHEAALKKGILEEKKEDKK
jgi:ABC-2 type transport system ATP-binding protein